MRNNSASQEMLESAELPSNPKEQKQLHNAYLNYRQVIGDEIYAIYGNLLAGYFLCCHQTLTILF